MFETESSYIWPFLHRDCIVVSISGSHVVGHAPQLGYTKDHHKNGKKKASLLVQPDCVKGQVVWETVYGNMHYKDLGLIKRIGIISQYGISI